MGRLLDLKRRSQAIAQRIALLNSSPSPMDVELPVISMVSAGAAEPYRGALPSPGSGGGTNPCDDLPDTIPFAIGNVTTPCCSSIDENHVADLLYTTSGAAGSFNAAKTTAGDGRTYWLADIGLIHYDAYIGNSGCHGDVQSSGDFPISIFILCSGGHLTAELWTTSTGDPSQFPRLGDETNQGLGSVSIENYDTAYDLYGQICSNWTITVNEPEA